MFERKSAYSHEEVLQCARGELFGPGNCRLPLPPMLMVDKIISVTENGGLHDKGYLEAVYEIRPDRWFFDCHFKDDPVMPGCLGLDAMWQLTGFFLGWLGGEGPGRALGVGEVKFKGMVLPTVKEVRYKISLKKIIFGKLKLAVSEGILEADGEPIYHADDMKVGLFKEKN